MPIPRPDWLYRRLKFRRLPWGVNLETVRVVLEEYGLELLAEPKSPPGPGRSQSLILDTDQGTRVLKSYKHTVIVPTIVHEHSILLHLAQVGFPAPRLVSTVSGETLVRRGEHRFALFDFIEGGFQYHNYILLPSQLRRFIAASGGLLAALHASLQDFVPQGYNPHGFKSMQESWWRDCKWYADRLARCIKDTRQRDDGAGYDRAAWLLSYADDLQESLLSLGAKLEAAALPRVIIHGDYGPYNLLFRRDGSVILLDFEIARLDWRATELVDALQRFSHNRFGFNVGKMKCFLDAYRARLAVPPWEVQLLPDVWTFLNVRRCIVHWHHYCDTRQAYRLAQAKWNLGLIDWMTKNRDMFLSHLSEPGA